MKKDNNIVDKKVKQLLDMNEVENIMFWEILDAFVRADIKKAQNLETSLGFAIQDYLLQNTEQSEGEQSCQ
mgnify:FL=1|jgi:hypothetical protein|tara:strand:+ start:1114 stop:1326 length:213 start_codon:yes stop_codon:yes gene_type:complete